MAAPNNNRDPLPADKALSAMLALLVADREDRIATEPDGTSLRKTEVVLAAGGLTAAEIVPLVGKNLEAVRSTIKRGRSK